jgi:predicted aspartyl protease
MTRSLILGVAALALLTPAAKADQAKPACTYAEVAQFPLHYSGPGLEITVDGQMNGSPALMLVDTGSYSISVTRTGVERRKLPLRYVDAHAIGVGGNARIANTRLSDLAVGPVHSGKTSVDVITSTGSTPAYDAIIGAPFLLQTDLEISLPDKTLKMYTASGCNDTFLALWDEGSIDVPFLRGYEKGKIPKFMVKVNGHDMKAIVDTGASISTIELEAARKAGLDLDAPGVKRIGDVAGIGANRVHRWSAVFDSFSIGSETISKPELSVIDTQGRTNVDVLLGADFLRSHRVLFAMSQGKLYVAYVGGDAFASRVSSSSWIRQEADTGNADAQYVLGEAYLSGHDSANGLAMLDKAAANGSPYAALALGRKLMREGRYADAEPRLAAALDKLPSERFGALLLYLARLHLGKAAAAPGELDAHFEGADGEWPAPIADFYLGRIDAEQLLSKARKDDNLSRARSCDANTFIAKWHAAHGDKAKADAFEQSAREQCRAPAGKPQA